MPPYERYSRQLQINKIGLAGQSKLKHTRVLIVGAGGLGCHVSSQLAGAGIGKITIVDHDEVSISNLHRQILFREEDIGKNKSLIANRELTKINSEIEIKHHIQRLNQSNLVEITDDATILVDASDNFLTSYILSDYCYANRIPLVSASVNSTFGWIAIFCGTKLKPSPSIRAIFPELASQLTSCDTVGVTGPSVGIIASIQAQEVIKVALDDDSQLLGKLLYLDLWNYKQHLVNFAHSKEPEQPPLSFILPADVTNEDLVIDVRNPSEVDESPLEFDNLLNIPLAEFDNKLGSLSKSESLVIACASGQRALIGAQKLLKNEFSQLSVLLPKD